MLVTKELVSRMKKGSVIVDVAVDQGGCIETIRPTTHANPVYEVDGVIHYGVTNMPGAVPRTSVFALTNATLPYLLKLAKEGLKAVEADPALKNGLNTHRGCITNRAVAEALGMDFTPYPSP
jgi:alanine dehydrogenase